MIYSFKCNCGEQYIVRTNQCLDARIKHHMPTKIREGNWLADKGNNTYGLGIADNPINNRDCTFSYSDDLFTVLIKSHSDFHLKILKTLHILTYQTSLS